MSRHEKKSPPALARRGGQENSTSNQNEYRSPARKSKAARRRQELLEFIDATLADSRRIAAAVRAKQRARGEPTGGLIILPEAAKTWSPEKREREVREARKRAEKWVGPNATVVIDMEVVS